MRVVFSVFQVLAETKVTTPSVTTGQLERCEKGSSSWTNVPPWEVDFSGYKKIYMSLSRVWTLRSDSHLRFGCMWKWRKKSTFSSES